MADNAARRKAHNILQQDQPLLKRALVLLRAGVEAQQLVQLVLDVAPVRVEIGASSGEDKGLSRMRMDGKHRQYE